MSRTINTVCGAISASQLGKVLVHEHLTWTYPGTNGNTTFRPDRAKSLDLMVTKLKRAKASGLTTMVDATPNDGGRDVLLLKDAAEQSGVNIICSTGFYTEPEGGANYIKVYDYLISDNNKLIYDIMYNDLYVGIEGTGIKAGVIKLSTSPAEMTPFEEKWFKAGAKLAADDPDVRIITHTHGTLCLTQAEYLLNAGVRPNQIAIGHLCNCPSLEEVLRVAELGVYLSLDRYGLQGLFGSPPDSRRTAMIFGLVGCGYGDKILISHDTNAILQGLGEISDYRPEYKEATAYWHWNHIFDNVLPDLQKRGLSKEQCDRLIAGNPQAFYG